MSGIDIFDFKHITKAPESTEEQPVHEVIKLFFQEYSFDKPNDGIAIDIKNNDIYLDPIIGIRGLRASGGIIEIKHADRVIDLLEKHEVNSWKTAYIDPKAEPIEDGGTWELIVQFADGTVKKHTGDERYEKPTNYDDFVSKLTYFIAEKINEYSS